MAMKNVVAALPALWLAACAIGPHAVCRDGERQAVADTLFFGTAKPDGAVTPAEWNDFLATTVTPRFPDGLTVWPAAGQWISATGIVREASYVVSIVHADDPARDSAIREIMQAYKTRFQQEAVLRTRAATCTTL
jgi:hypothetical protein